MYDLLPPVQCFPMDATLKARQSGLAHRTSGQTPKERGSKSNMFLIISGSNLGSISKVKASMPLSRATCENIACPENNSNDRKFISIPSIHPLHYLRVLHKKDTVIYKHIEPYHQYTLMGLEEIYI